MKILNLVRNLLMEILKNCFLVFVFLTFCVGLFFAQKKHPLTNSTNNNNDSVKKESHTVETPHFATDENFQLLVKENKAVIVHYGFVPVYNKEFEKKYGIKILNAGCVIIPGENHHSTKNNQIISKYLTGKFGEIWKKDLGFSPFGVQ